LICCAPVLSMMPSRGSIDNVERPQWRREFGRLQCRIAPLAEDQWPALVSDAEPFHFGDEKNVVAAIMRGPRSALEHRGDAGQQRGFESTNRIVHSLPLGGARPCEPVRDVLLVFGQY